MSSFLTNVSLYKNNVEKIYREKGKKERKQKNKTKTHFTLIETRVYRQRNRRLHQLTIEDQHKQ